MKVNPVAMFLLGFGLGYLLGPTAAHAASDYSSQLSRLVSAAERIASTLEKAAR